MEWWAAHGDQLITAAAALVGVALGASAEWLRHRRQHGTHRQQLYSRQLLAAEALLGAMWQYLAAVVLVPGRMLSRGEYDDLRDHLRDDYFRISEEFNSQVMAFTSVLPAEVVAEVLEFFLSVDRVDSELRSQVNDETTTDIPKLGELLDEVIVGFFSTAGAVRATLCVEELAGDLKTVVPQLRSQSVSEKLLVPPGSDQDN